MSTKVLFLFQDSIQDPTLHLIVISPSFPLFCDYFVIFPCSWIWLFWKVPGQMFWNAPQVCIYLIFYQHFIGDIGFFSLFFFFWKISQSFCPLFGKVSEFVINTFWKWIFGTIHTCTATQNQENTWILLRLSINFRSHPNQEL